VQGELARVKNIAFADIESIKKVGLISFSWCLLCRHNRFLRDSIRRLALSTLLKPLCPVNRTGGQNQSLKRLVLTLSSDRARNTGAEGRSSGAPSRAHVSPSSTPSSAQASFSPIQIIGLIGGRLGNLLSRRKLQLPIRWELQIRLKIIFSIVGISGLRISLRSGGCDKRNRFGKWKWTGLRGSDSVASKEIVIFVVVFESIQVDSG